ncbi:gamma-glutamylcyclotransferase family protein [Fervidibacillus albus]|uniref:Gamma-glutamylcyclotransferase n=1 Tax=Fervidibacillus albus TaxID=2980026 RepID=A0A9E8LST4_9BACI|nr:gamma-glutamylcyclotransferase family protein [Fervidibacillus albus]WAA08953.1 gamma-glutamylcyclotransferase [Fervidibacillus albus]
MLDSYKVPSDARFDFCHMPTFIGTAIVMKVYFNGDRAYVAQLEKALEACVRGRFIGHGYDGEIGRIDVMKTLIKGGLRTFLETEREICQAFHNKVHNILHEYHSRLIRNLTKGKWGEDYRDDWQQIVDDLKLTTRLYIAYGSNMDQSQMLKRCPNAKRIGKTYLKDWELTIPFYANIEKKKGKQTPAFVWEINESDENNLNIYEGYPRCYDKTNIVINVEGKTVSAMAYVMTEQYKNKDKQPRDGYIEQILRGYREAGFDEAEFQPRSIE